MRLVTSSAVNAICALGIGRRDVRWPTLPLLATYFMGHVSVVFSLLLYLQWYFRAGSEQLYAKDLQPLGELCFYFPLLALLPWTVS